MDTEIEQDRSKWDHSGKKPIIVTCENCGSAGVTRDATVRWSVEDQRWEVSGVFDNADCDQCGGETRLEDTPVDMWTGDACMKEEIPSGNWIAAKRLADGSYIGIAHHKDGTVATMLDEDVFGSAMSSAEEAKDAARHWLNRMGEI